MIGMLAANDISPTLKDILNQFDEENRRPDINYSPQVPIAEDFPEGNDQMDVGENGFDDDCGAWNLDHDDHLSVADDNSTNINLNYANDLEVSFF